MHSTRKIKTAAVGVLDKHFEKVIGGFLDEDANASTCSSFQTSTSSACSDLNDVSDLCKDEETYNELDSPSTSQKSSKAGSTGAGSLKYKGSVDWNDVGSSDDGEICRSQPEVLSKNAITNADDMDLSKRFDYLLRQAELFAHFVKPACSTDSNSYADNTNGNAVPSRRGRKKKNALQFFQHRSRRNPDIEEPSCSAEKSGFSFATSPEFIKNGTMRDYQIRGLNWLISLFERKIGGILADEMGLGKTIQTIALLGYLKHYRGIIGPHLVIAPKSTLRNWEKEVKKWCPSLNAVCLIGDKEERKALISDVILRDKWNVCVTSYEMAILETSVLKKYNWSYLIIDEAHRIKNEATVLSKKVRLLSSRARLLLSGTPLQNNLHELWALLNFLLPELFKSSEDFDAWFNMSNCLGDQTLISRLHAVLRPFLLRRIKSDVEKSIPPKKELKVYVGLSQLQKEWYRKVLLDDIHIIRGGVLTATRALNVLMQLRKVCNHPYLFPGVEPGPPYRTDVHIIENCGKMIVLDKLLLKLKTEGSKVLLFCQMTRMLDILEDYCFMRKFLYCRLDGSTGLDQRYEDMHDFNSHESDKFLFLLSTRAGGLGINLTGADVVIIYDSDWNPQADLQAMDRAHRIGQTKEVRIFRLITENTVEEKIDEKADIKLHLDRLVIQQGRLVESVKQKKHDLLRIVQYGAEKIFAASKETGVTDEDIDTILAKSKTRTDKLIQQFAGMDEESLRHFTIDAPTPDQISSLPMPTKASSSCHEFEGVDYRVLRNQRQRRENKLVDTGKYENIRKSYKISHEETSREGSVFDMDPDYDPSDAFENENEDTPDKSLTSTSKTNTNSGFKKYPRHPAKVPKPKLGPDFWFQAPRAFELHMKQYDRYLLSSGCKVALMDDIPLTEAIRLQTLEQERLQKSSMLSADEVLEKANLEADSFKTWKKNHFNLYLTAVERYGLNDLELISRTVRGKKQEEVVAYHQIFWKRCHELINCNGFFTDKLLRSEVTKLITNRKQILDFKISQYRNPVTELQIPYGSVPKSTNRFTDETDRSLILALHKVGLETPECFQKLHKLIRYSSDFDYFLRARTITELHARCNLLLNLIEEEYLFSKSQLGKLVDVSETESSKENVGKNRLLYDDQMSVCLTPSRRDIFCPTKTNIASKDDEVIPFKPIRLTYSQNTTPITSPVCSQRLSVVLENLPITSGLSRTSSTGSAVSLEVDAIKKNSQDLYVLLNRLPSSTSAPGSAKKRKIGNNNSQGVTSSEFTTGVPEKRCKH